MEINVFYCASSIPRDSRCCGQRQNDPPMEAFRDRDGMRAIVVTAKVCKSTTFIARHRSRATSVSARRMFSWSISVRSFSACGTNKGTTFLKPKRYFLKRYDVRVIV
jgi:hypothetical protein